MPCLPIPYKWLYGLSAYSLPVLWPTLVWVGQP